jgi:hypothetical protein
VYAVYGVFGMVAYGGLSRMAFAWRLRSMSTAPAANSRPPSAKAAMMMPTLAPLDRPGFGQFEVTVSAMPVAPAICVPVTRSVVLKVVVTVVVGIAEVVRGTLVTVSVTGTPKSLHAAMMYEKIGFWSFVSHACGTSS